jgi:hypothetical protein
MKASVKHFKGRMKCLVKGVQDATYDVTACSDKSRAKLQATFLKSPCIFAADPLPWISAMVEEAVDLAQGSIGLQSVNGSDELRCAKKKANACAKHYQNIAKCLIVFETAPESFDISCSTIVSDKFYGVMDKASAGVCPTQSPNTPTLGVLLAGQVLTLNTTLTQGTCGAFPTCGGPCPTGQSCRPIVEGEECGTQFGPGECRCVPSAAPCISTSCPSVGSCDPGQACLVAKCSGGSCLSGCCSLSGETCVTGVCCNGDLCTVGSLCP